MHQPADIGRLDAAMPKQVFRAGVDRHDGVEQAGLYVTVELNQDFGFAHGVVIVVNRLMSKAGMHLTTM